MITIIAIILNSIVCISLPFLIHDKLQKIIEYQDKEVIASIVFDSIVLGVNAICLILNFIKLIS